MATDPGGCALAPRKGAGMNQTQARFVSVWSRDAEANAFHYCRVA